MESYVQFCIPLYKEVLRQRNTNVWEEAKEVDFVQLEEKAKGWSNAVFNYLTGDEGKDRARFFLNIEKEQAVMDIAAR